MAKSEADLLKEWQTSGNKFVCTDCGAIYDGYEGCWQCREQLHGEMEQY